MKIWGLAALAACILLFCILFWPERGPVSLPARAGVLLTEVTNQSSLGLPPPTTDEFFHSALGAPLSVVMRPLRVNLLGGYRVYQVQELAIDETDGAVIVTATARRTEKDWFSGPEVRYFKYRQICRLLSPHGRTCVLLLSATSGTHRWKQAIPGIRGSSFPDAASVEPPAIGFDIPRTPSELAGYRSWLAKMTGSRNRFRDGWGHMIQMKLIDRQGRMLLAASSAGSDGKWGTKDDMVLIRDTKTGKIVKDVPGRPNPYAGLKPKHP